jgi:release factor glutamine methyltransferase
MKIIDLLKKAQELTLKSEDKDALFWLLTEMLNMDKSTFYLSSEKIVDDSFKNSYLNQVSKYLNDNIPVQYLVGYTYFYGNKFYVSENTLIPRRETEELVSYTKELIDKYFSNEKINILDIGTGSGCIGLTLKGLTNSNVTLSDISPKALEIAEKNMNNLNLEVNIINSNWLDSINDNFDVIVSNPPYIKETYSLEEKVLKEPLNALFSGTEGIDSYEEILKSIAKNLKSKFIIAFEHGYDQKEQINSLVNKYLSDIIIINKKDLSDKDRFTFIIKEV